VEQTADSTPLPSFVFPRRACLVLGREKEGLPPELLALMDACVEIPQFGVVRSLNVHVSAAVTIYEFTRQGKLVAGAAAAAAAAGGGGGGGQHA
jgi:tRNA guanosine-2'-O-methyltransferase